jgi:hypothetical protein
VASSSLGYELVELSNVCPCALIPDHGAPRMDIIARCVGQEQAVTRGNFGCSVGGTMGKTRERQIILKADQRTILLELGLGGKLQAKSSGWDKNRNFPRGR